VLVNITLFGAVIGGFLAGNYGYSITFLISMMISIVSLIFLKKYVHETRKPTKKFFHASREVLFSIKVYLKDINWFLRQGKSVMAIFIVAAVLYAWYGVSVFIPIFLAQRFNADLFTIGIVLTLINLPFMSVEYFFGRISDAVGEWKMIGIGLIISGVFISAVFFSTSILVFTFLNILASIGNTILEPLAESVSGKLVNEARRGRLSAIINAGKDVGAIIGVIFAGFIAQAAGIPAVFLFSGLSFILCYAVVLFWKKFK
jgi:MFS family permease